MKSLIIGMGIGQLYKTVLTELGAEITTVDSDIAKGADFPSIESAIISRGSFDTVHICTPNFTHMDIALKIAKHSRIVFIEKPGVKHSTNWSSLVHTYKDTRFMMVKNNMWRDNIKEIELNAKLAKTIDLNWINKDRVPSPGSWFTTKKLSFGGVSRDLMPHLLSLYISLNSHWKYSQLLESSSLIRYELKDLDNTEYGTVNSQGTYDVDDLCNISFDYNGQIWNLTADWRNLKEDKRNIELTFDDGSKIVYELGLCPEDAYKKMISQAWEERDNDSFWNTQFLHDFWIHERIEQF
jgi:predicted dehydrogenase